MAFPALLDTCVLYPQHLNDTLLRLAVAELFRPLWSPCILAELSRNLDERVGSAASERRLDAMRRHFPDAEVHGYQSLIEVMVNEPKDRHVLAAAVRAGAEVIVTYNLDDFPPVALVDYELEITHPDDFLCDQLALNPVRTLDCLHQQVAGYRKQPTTVDDLMAFFRTRSGLPKFADDVQHHLW